MPAIAVMLDNELDPREVDRQQQATKAAQGVLDAARAVTVGEVWTLYLEARRPQWGARHYADHVKLARQGGEKSNRGTRGRGVTIDMPLFPLMAGPLRELTAPVIEAWATREAVTRPTPARLALTILKAFLSWCAEQPQYAAVMPSSNPAKTKKAREALGKPGVKQDALLREQLAAWFAAVRGIENDAIATYLQVMLLTGARPGEVREMQWVDLDTKWKVLTIRDKVDGERVIPLTPDEEYHGDVDEDDMSALSARGYDSLNVQHGVRVCVNDKVIGALQSWVSDGPIPYDFRCYRERQSSPSGPPYPLEMEHQQRVEKSAWRQVMSNAAPSAGYRVIVKKGAVTPANNNLQFESRKFLYVNDDVEDVTKVFHILQEGSRSL